MTTIGIDPGNWCGWAVLDATGQRLASGRWDLRPRRHEGGGMRYVRARSMLAELLDAYPGSVLGYEEVRRHAGTDAAHVYGGFVAAFSALCEERGVPYSGVPVGSVKRTATGRGVASKSDMHATASNRWGRVQSEDEADALWIAETLRLEVAP